MAKAYPIEIRNRVIRKYNEGKTVAEIVSELSVGQRFVFEMLRLHKTGVSLEPKPRSGGRKPTLDEEKLAEIEALVLETPDITLQEIKESMGLSISISIICDAINANQELKKIMTNGENNDSLGVWTYKPD